MIVKCSILTNWDDHLLQSHNYYYYYNRFTTLLPGLSRWVGTRRVTILDYAEAEMMGWQWHQLNHMQAIHTLLQMKTTPAPHQSDFYRPHALPDTLPTASKHWRPYCLTSTTDYVFVNDCWADHCLQSVSKLLNNANHYHEPKSPLTTFTPRKLHQVTRTQPTEGTAEKTVAKADLNLKTEISNSQEKVFLCVNRSGSPVIQGSSPLW